MITFLVILLCAVFVCALTLFFRLQNLQKLTASLDTVKTIIEHSKETVNRLNETYDVMTNKIADLNAEKARLDSLIEIAGAKTEAAVTLAEKELELEREKQLSEFNQKLEEEKKTIEANSDLTKYLNQLKEVNTQIEAAHRTLKVQQEQASNAAEKEDFIAFHSIELTPKDLRDIEMIREFATKLVRQEAVFKLIWTEYIQKPIQALCKVVGAEKACGIYKIAHIESDRMYIGQAIDIAARWKDHCKAGLGIGSTGYLTNKFYKALHKEGIEKFTFEVLEICSIDKLNERESYWIDFFNATSFGYNSKSGG